MKNLIAKLHLAIMNLKSDEGQDLVEYALLIALIAFACTAGIPVDRSAGKEMKLPPPATALRVPLMTAAQNRKMACRKCRSYI